MPIRAVALLSLTAAAAGGCAVLARLGAANSGDADSGSLAIAGLLLMSLCVLAIQPFGIAARNRWTRAQARPAAPHTPQKEPR